MSVRRPRICAAIASGDLAAIEKVEPFVDLFEVRIDLIGGGWREVAAWLDKPWLACNRSVREGGRWTGGEPERTGELMEALEMGAEIIDIELGTPHIEDIVRRVKEKAECLISCHNLETTPPLPEMRETVRRQLAAGADICKVVTTATSLADCLTTLQLIGEFPQARVVAFAMGDYGQVSRVLCPLVGGDFTFASVEEGRESAPGQLTAAQLRHLYGMF